MGSAAIKLGQDTTAGTLSRLYITQSSDEDVKPSNACNTEPRLNTAGEWTVGACNKEGR